MNKKVASVEAQRPHLTKGIDENSLLFSTIIDAITDKKGENIISLGLKHIDEAVSDYFIVCEANSNTQIKAIADNIVDKVQEKCNEKPFHTEGGLIWTLIDYVNIVVHIFLPDERKFYDIEGCWLDAEKKHHD